MSASGNDPVAVATMERTTTGQRLSTPSCGGLPPSTSEGRMAQSWGQPVGGGMGGWVGGGWMGCGGQKRRKRNLRDEFLLETSPPLLAALCLPMVCQDKPLFCVAAHARLLSEAGKALGHGREAGSRQAAAHGAGISTLVHPIIHVHPLPPPSRHASQPNPTPTAAAQMALRQLVRRVAAVASQVACPAWQRGAAVASSLVRVDDAWMMMKTLSPTRPTLPASLLVHPPDPSLHPSQRCVSTTRTTRFAFEGQKAPVATEEEETGEPAGTCFMWMLTAGTFS